MNKYEKLKKAYEDAKEKISKYTAKDIADAFYLNSFLEDDNEQLGKEGKALRKKYGANLSVENVPDEVVQFYKKNFREGLINSYLKDSDDTDAKELWKFRVRKNLEAGNLDNLDTKDFEKFDKFEAFQKSKQSVQIKFDDYKEAHLEDLLPEEDYKKYKAKGKYSINSLFLDELEEIYPKIKDKLKEKYRTEIEGLLKDNQELKNLYDSKNSIDAKNSLIDKLKPNKKKSFNDGLERTDPEAVNGYIREGDNLIGVIKNKGNKNPKKPRLISLTATPDEKKAVKSLYNKAKQEYKKNYSDEARDRLNTLEAINNQIGRNDRHDLKKLSRENDEDFIHHKDMPEDVQKVYPGSDNTLSELYQNAINKKDPEAISKLLDRLDAPENADLSYAKRFERLFEETFPEKDWEFDDIPEWQPSPVEKKTKKKMEKKLESLAEEKPEVAIENKDIIPNTAKEAEQVIDSNPHNDEANNEEIKKDIGKSFVSPNVLLNSGYEDGLLKRDEEQQKEFDKIKEESDRKAAEWREQQANKFANRESKEVDNSSEESPSREQPIEDNAIDENAYDAELKRLSGSKKKSKKRLTDMESNPLESLEFNPEEFNKQYEIDHPELKIKDELSDDEKNDIDYKPSQEELDALNQANREEWEENGRPRNKDLADKTIDLPNDFMDKQVEAAIESNPSQAEEVAEETLGEGNPIENEAEQANDPSIPQNDEVNNEEISKADPNQKSEFLNQMGQDLNQPDVVDYGLEDANNYAPNPLSDQTLDRIKNQLAEEEDKTIYKENNLPDLNIEQIPEEEMRKLFDPLNKEIESRQKALASAEENLQLAQMHFDENPNDENAAALNKANQAYKDAEFLLQNKQKEFEEAYKNLGNYYQPKEEIGEFIKEVEPTKLNLPEFGKSNDVDIHSTSTPSSNLNNTIDMSDKKSGVGGPRAGLGRIGGIGMGSIHSPNLSNNNNNPKMESLHSRASKAPIPEKRNENGAIVKGGSTNNKPSSNGTMSSGPSMLFGKHTNYQSPNKIAPAIPSLGHTSQVAPIGNVPGVGNSSKQDPKMILIAAIESKLNELSQKNPNLLQKLQLDHKYKHWAWRGISLDEMNPTQLNELYSKISSSI